MSHKPEDIDRDNLPPLPDIEPLPEFESLRKPIPPVPQPEDALSCRTESDE